MDESLRLTQMTHSAGCAAKLGKGTLDAALSLLPRFSDMNLLVGFDTSDDACVYKLRDDLAVLQTVDFFPPMVDDAYLFGQIAAANAMSDIYAMGGEPSLALNLLCVPKKLPRDMVMAILEGGHSKAAEANAVIAGGHTIIDPEPKYGLCVSGFLHPDQVVGNSSVKRGDVLVLTKPLGAGIAATAAKVDMITPESFKQATDSMSALNKYARDAAKKIGISACTDVTGFGLIGHASEMADASKVTIELFSDKPAVLPEVEKLARMGLIPEGAYRNREYAENRITVKDSLPLHIMDILFDPETSGGLLISLPERKANALLSLLEEFTPHARIVGHAIERKDMSINVI